MNALIINCSPVRTGATAEIARIVTEQLSAGHSVKSICIDDYAFEFCRGCRSCHETAKCIMRDADVIQSIMDELDAADIIVSVSPSYWADIPGQFKAFIDRCTPWCNTHNPHAAIGSGKRGYVIALRTGPNMPECERIIGSIEHFYGHLEIECRGHLGLTSVECRDDVEPRKKEIIDFCTNICMKEPGAEIELKPVMQEDIETVWKMQVEAFSELLKKYQDYDTSPAAEEMDKVSARFEQPWTNYYFIMVNHEKVGVIRIIDKKDGSRKRISPIWIMAEHRNKGYAQQAIEEAERIHGKDHWCLDTVLQEKGNLYLYEKMGYHQTGKVEHINDRMDIVFYEKD